MYLKIAILVLAIADFGICLDDIHKFMTPDEVQQVFNTDHENVPEHEVVKVHLSKNFLRDTNEKKTTWKKGQNLKRDLPIGSFIKTRAFGKDIKLWLVPDDRVLIGTLTPVYRISTYHGRNRKLPLAITRVSNPFQFVTSRLANRRQSAFFTVRRDLSGILSMNGYIGSENLVIKSLPRGVIDKYMRKRRSINDQDNLLDSFDHVVYRSNINDENVKLFPSEVKVKLVERQAGSGIPDTLYPEILVIVEYSTFYAHGRSFLNLLEYLANFWNGVDLKYRSLESPAFRLHIAGILIATDSFSTPYISNNIENATHFHRHPAMDDAEKFFYKIDKIIPINSYDIAVTITNLNLIDSSGIANINGACKVEHEHKIIKGIVIVQDDAAFRGVAASAHEIGHSIGAEHDQSISCPASDNFIMLAGFARSPHASDFSKCSLASFQVRIMRNELTCFYNKPSQDGDTLPIVLPGQIIDRDTFCKKSGYYGSLVRNIPGLDECSYVYCRISRRISIIYGLGIGSALDGTECDRDDTSKFCLHQKCVSLDD